MAEKEQPGAGECNSDVGCKLLMITQQWFNKLVRDGWIKKAGKNRYRVVDVVQGYVKYLQDENRRATKSASASRVQDARAQQIEMQMAKEQRELIPIEDVAAFLSDTLGALRSELTGVPAASSRDPAVRAEIEKNQDAAIERCRAAFASGTKAIRSRQPIAVDAEEADA